MPLFERAVWLGFHHQFPTLGLGQPRDTGVRFDIVIARRRK